MDTGIGNYNISIEFNKVENRSCVIQFCGNYSELCNEVIKLFNIKF